MKVPWVLQSLSLIDLVLNIEGTLTLFSGREKSRRSPFRIARCVKTGFNSISSLGTPAMESERWKTNEEYFSVKPSIVHLKSAWAGKNGVGFVASSRTQVAFLSFFSFCPLAKSK